MTAPGIRVDENHLRAATLTFALLRFEDGATHADRSCHLPAAPHLGEDAYVFLPALRPIACGDVVSFLAGLPSPALLVPTTKRGIVALTLLSELSGERATGARKIFANQRANVEVKAKQLRATPATEVLLSLPDETHAFSFEIVRVWSERFAVQIGWNIVPKVDDSVVRAQFALFRSDGATNLSRSWEG